MEDENNSNDQQKNLVWLEFDRLCQHSLLADCDGLIKILRYTVDATLSSDTKQLKEYCIGVDALGRKDDFDPRIESIVRTQAAKLRNRLSAIYEKDGTPLGVRLSYRRGSYKVAIAFGPAQSLPAPNSPMMPPIQTLSRGTITSQPILLLTHPQSFLRDAQPSAASTAASLFLAQLLVSIQNFGHLAVAHPERILNGQNFILNPRQWHTGFGIDFVLDVNLIYPDSNPQLNCSLIDAARDILLWKILIPLNEPARSGAANIVAARIDEIVAPPLAPAAPTQMPNPSDEMLHAKLHLAHHFLHQLNPQSLERARRLLDTAAQENPLHRGIAISRNITLNTQSFLTNNHSPHLRNLARASLIIAMASSPEDDLEVRCLNQLTDAVFDWIWPSLSSVQASCQSLAANRGLVVPYFAFLIALPLGLHKECEFLLTQNSNHEPTNPTIPTFLGWTHLAAGNTNQARTAFLEALELDPRCAYATEGLSRLDSPNASCPTFPGNPAFPAALQFAQAGQAPLVLHHLSQAIGRHEGRTLSVCFDPAFQQFRASPEYIHFRSTMRGRNGLSA